MAAKLLISIKQRHKPIMPTLGVGGRGAGEMVLRSQLSRPSPQSSKREGAVPQLSTCSSFAVWQPGGNMTVGLLGQRELPGQRGARAATQMVSSLEPIVIYFSFYAFLSFMTKCQTSFSN